MKMNYLLCGSSQKLKKIMIKRTSTNRMRYSTFIIKRINTINYLNKLILSQLKQYKTLFSLLSRKFSIRISTSLSKTLNAVDKRAVLRLRDTTKRTKSYST